MSVTITATKEDPLRKFLCALAVCAALALTPVATGTRSAAADYTTSFGTTYTTAQVQQLCVAMRPVLAATKPYCQ